MEKYKTYKTSIFGRRWFFLGLAGFLIVLAITWDFTTSLAVSLFIDAIVLLIDKLGWIGNDLTVTLSSTGCLSFFHREELSQKFIVNECRFIANFTNPSDPNSNVSDCMLAVSREGHPVMLIDCGLLGKRKFLRLLHDLGGAVKRDAPAS